MAIPLGHWGKFARARGKTVNGTAAELGIHQSTLIRYLNGDATRLGKRNRILLRKLWRLSKARFEEEMEKARQSRRNGENR